VSDYIKGISQSSYRNYLPLSQMSDPNGKIRK
jgi:hypothetical protein